MLHSAAAHKRIIAWIGGALGLALLVSGLFIRDTTQWRLQLLAGIWLLSLPFRARRQPAAQPRGAASGLHRLMLVFGLAFAAVGLQLAREQVSQAAAIRAQATGLFQPVPEQPASDDTIRPVDRTALGSGRTWPVATSVTGRGNILDRNGTLLATSEAGRRVYPYPDLGQIVGFNSRLYGLTGIEAQFDDYLSGASSLTPLELLEARLAGSGVDVATADVQLTLDLNLQQAAQAALGERAGAVALLDPQTGAILALASYPRFDPNRLLLPDPATDADVAQVQAVWQELTERADSPLLNRATQGRYPPGSVIKTLTAAAALDSAVLANPQSPITCPNRLSTEAGAPPVVNAVENLERSTGNPSDLHRVFAFSCNTAFAQLGLALGPEQFGDYAGRFGLGFANNPTAADLRDISAAAGTIANTADFLQRPVALADTAFGQGQALVTPLDMAQMVAVIASDGQLLRPYLVQEARMGSDVVYRAQPESLRQVIAAEAAQQMRAVMQTSVEIGYARPVALPGVTVGAKTGTAETPRGVPHSWFVAIAPVEQPRFAIAVVVEYGGEGSQAALPVARQVLATALGVQQ